MNWKKNIKKVLREEIRNKRLVTIQKLIDVTIESLKDKCGLNTEDDEYVAYSTCELLDSDIKIYVKDFEIVNNVSVIKIDITYNNVTRYLDYDDLVWELQSKLKPFLNLNKIKVEKYDNLFPEENRQW